LQKDSEKAQKLKSSKTQKLKTFFFLKKKQKSKVVKRIFAIDK